MKYSVVTVCYNAQKTIGATIESVLSQEYDDYEYVIMDGGSSDETLEIISKYTDNSKIRLFSEPDSGLYNAMNKSLNHISADYVIFMNSGDLFFDNMVLADIAPLLGADIVYGNAHKRCTSGDYIEKYTGNDFEPYKMMLCGAFFCHQAQFTRTSIMNEYRFRESHRITADYDFIVRALAGKCSFRYIDRVICSFDNDGGISAQKSNYMQMIREDDASVREFFPFLYYLTCIPKKMFRVMFRKEYI